MAMQVQDCLRVIHGKTEGGSFATERLSAWIRFTTIPLLLVTKLYLCQLTCINNGFQTAKGYLMYYKNQTNLRKKKGPENDLLQYIVVT